MARAFKISLIEAGRLPVNGAQVHVPTSQKQWHRQNPKVNHAKCEPPSISLSYR